MLLYFLFVCFCDGHELQHQSCEEAPRVIFGILWRVRDFRSYMLSWDNKFKLTELKLTRFAQTEDAFSPSSSTNRMRTTFIVICKLQI